MGNLIDTIGLREALRKTKSWCENKFAKASDFNEVSAQVTDNQTLLTEIKGTFTALQSGNADVTKAQVATNTGRITQAESSLSDLSLKKADKKGNIGYVEQMVAMQGWKMYQPGCATITELNGKVTMTKTVETTNASQLTAIYYTNTQTVASHKYITSVYVKTSIDTTVKLLATHGNYSLTQSVSANIRTRLSCVDITVGGRNRFCVFVDDWVGKGTGMTCEIEEAMFIDLTEMFGAGNEPTTATEFAQALGYDSIDDVPYIPYSASAITMPDATSVKGLLTQKVMASEVCLGEYTLRCNGSSLVAVDSSGNETTLLGSASTTSLDDDTNSELPNE